MATTTAPAFASSSVNGFTVKTTSTTTGFSAGGDTVVSPNISTNVDNINNKKLIMGIDVKVAYANVAATLVLQASHNGTDWVDYATLSSDTTPDVTGVKLFVVDTTNLYAPYYRLHFNPTGLTVGTSGTLQFFLANK